MGRDDTSRNHRLECLKLAVSVHLSGQIPVNDIVIQAGRYYDFLCRDEKKDQAHGAPDEQVSAG